MPRSLARLAGVVQPDLRHWQGLALRMRLLDAATDTVERNSFRSEAESVANERNELRSTRSRRPWTWRMLKTDAQESAAGAGYHESHELHE